MSQWSAIARATIQKVALTIPDDATLKERKAAIDAAYPFGPRSHWPYMAWLKARRTYLRRYDRNVPPTALPFAEFPRDPVTGRPLIP